LAGETMTIESLRTALHAIQGTEERPSRFIDGPALWVGRTEIAHFDDDEVMDIRLTRSLIRARRSELRAAPAVTLRPSSSSDWLEIAVTSSADELLCIELVEAAARAHMH
jgi:hypothetical protein